MADLDPFAVQMTCPLCGDPDAKMTLSAVKCPHKTCANFDGRAPDPAPSAFTPVPPESPAAPPSQPPPQAPAAPDKEPKHWKVRKAKGPVPNPEKKPKTKAPAERFDPVGNRLEIKYRNNRGEEKTFVGDRATVKASGEHISLRVAPSGIRIALAKKRILNMADVNAAVPTPPPTPGEKDRVAGQKGCRGCLLIIFLPLILWALVHFFGK